MKKFVMICSIMILVVWIYHAYDMSNSENVSSEIEEIVQDEKEIEIAEAEKIEEEIQYEDINLSFLGDVMTDSYIGEYIDSYGVDYPFEEVKNILLDDDMTIANFESSISLRGETLKPKGYGFRSKPYTIEGLVNNGIDTVSLANNHILDFGEVAFNDIIDYLNEYGIRNVGAGDDTNQAEKPLIIKKDNYTIGIIAYNSIIPWESWKATDDNAGTAWFTKDYNDKIIENIINTKEECDLVFVVLHWGVEYSNEPEDWQIELAHRMIDSGADGVIGHHPHVLQAIEIYNDKPILYSIGNFVFLKKDEDAGRTGIFQLKYNGESFVQGQYHPVYLKYCKANLLPVDSDMGEDYIKHLTDLSNDYNTMLLEDGIFKSE
ncbi:MAG: CapA family protein [Bacillota bacterium]|nr:CapA family protein [Bacillota bacterium]